MVAAVVWLTAACSRKGPETAVPVDALPAIYPDYVGVTVPPNIAPMNFAMQNDSVTAMSVEVKGSGGGSLSAEGAYADFDIGSWHHLLADSRGGQLTVTVCAEQDGRWTRYRDFTIFVSSDTIGDWGVTYRRIAPGYEQYGLMGLYQRCLADFRETPLVENSHEPGMCLNCHTANRANPDQYVFHARGTNAGTVIARQQAQTEVMAAKNERLGGAMVYPYWHPGGRYCAFSTNATSQMFHAGGQRRIEVYDASSDVFVYDTHNHAILADTAATMRKYWAENTPAFSPDGRWLYFTTARRQIYPTDYDKERYSLCRVAFDEATGRFGNRVDTLISAYATGRSVSWPRPSYDGRYLMYTEADYGYFTIWHDEADLCLLDLQSGGRRTMGEVNSSRAESFHNWSSDSRWFLFTSRRDDGLYTRLYFARMGDDGKATKPFMLPQRNPKDYYRQALFSYNTPDFTVKPVAATADEMARRLGDSRRTPMTGR